MKIAYFLDAPRGFGGAASLLLRQAKLMAVLHEVIAVIPCDENGYANEEGIKRCRQYQIPVRVIYFDTSFDFQSIDLLGAQQSAKVIRSFAETEQIEFFHSVQLNIAAELAARQLKIPHLMNIYQMREEEFSLHYGDIFPRYHLCDSWLYSDLWSCEMNIESRCARPIAPLDWQKKKCRRGMRGFTIVMVGKVGVRKKQLVGIQAVERCLDTYDVRLVIAGDAEGEYAKECREYIQQKNLQEKIQMLGFVEDMEPLFDQGDCLLCTSVDESFPTSMVEAVTYDMTVVTTPVAGVPELFRNGQNGFVSADFSVDSIYRSLTACFRAYESGEIETIHSNAADTWEHNFSPAVIRNQMQQYYDFIRRNCKCANNSLKELERDVMHTFLLIENAGLEQWIGKKSLYYTFLGKKIKGGRKAYIWGAGFLGKSAYDLLGVLQLDICLEAFVDRAKWGEYCSLPVIKPEEIAFAEEIFVFISFDYKKEEAIEYLKKHGLSYNKDIWLLP